MDKKQLSTSRFNPRRKRKVVDFFLQMQLAVEILLLSVVLFCFVIFILSVPPVATMFSDFPLEIHHDVLVQLVELNVPKWPIYIFAVFMWVFVTILFSHRIAGPYYRFLTFLQRYRKRDFRQSLSLRKHDFFHGLVPLINDVVANTKVDLQAISGDLDTVLVLLEKGDAKSIQESKALLKSVHDRIDQYQLDEQG